MANAYIHVAQFAEQGSSPATPTSGNRKIYPKSDGWYELDSSGTENKISRYNISAGVSKTIASGIVATGTDRNLVIGAETGATDTLDEITGLSVGDFVYVRAAVGHTITVTHNSGSATVKILTIGSKNVDLNENNPLVFVLADTNKLEQISYPILSQITPQTAKGDLIVANVSAVPQRLAVGTNNQILVADSAQTLGVKWAANTVSIGSGVNKGISSGVITTGADRNIVAQAETGTSDDLIEISGLSVGDVVYLRADAGDTITIKHNDAGATNKIHLRRDADLILDEQNPLELLQIATNVLVEVGDVAINQPTIASNFFNTFSAVSGNAVTWSTDTAQQHNGSWFQATTVSNGDSAEGKFFLKAGSYTLYVYGITGAVNGIIDWSIDGTNVLTGQDWYAASTTRNVVKSGAVTVATNGMHTLRLTINGKNASSSNYFWSLTHWIIR